MGVGWYYILALAAMFMESLFNTPTPGLELTIGQRWRATMTGMVFRGLWTFCVLKIALMTP